MRRRRRRHGVGFESPPLGLPFLQHVVPKQVANVVCCTKTRRHHAGGVLTKSREAPSIEQTSTFRVCLSFLTGWIRQCGSREIVIMRRMAWCWWARQPCRHSLPQGCQPGGRGGTYFSEVRDGSAIPFRKPRPSQSRADRRLLDRGRHRGQATSHCVRARRRRARSQVVWRQRPPPRAK